MKKQLLNLFVYKHYCNDSLEHPNRNLAKPEAVAPKQEPFAIILGCAASRVSPEIILDQGLGDFL